MRREARKKNAWTNNVSLPRPIGTLMEKQWCEYDEEEASVCVSAVPALRRPHVCGGQCPFEHGTTDIMLSALESVYSVQRALREGA